MEKQVTKAKNKFLKLLPRATQAAISFRNLPFSPRRDNRPDGNGHRHKHHHGKGFSGPIVPMIPAEARRKSRHFETQEPTSPKVSCIGQIKHKNKISKKKQVSLPNEFRSDPIRKPEKNRKARPEVPVPERKKKASGIKRIFGRRARAPIDRAEPDEGGAPSLSQMRKFASSRDTLANFDWKTAQIAPDEDRGFYSDGERGYSDDEDDVSIPFSAPISMDRAGGLVGLDLEPKKEINLWKRRTMAQPKPLQLSLD